MSIYLGEKPISNTGYDKANTSLSNLSSSGKNIANWSNNITNCITEIPQDIKLELNNGTLTLKAGSKVYVPNGAGVFDEVVIDSDKSTTGVSYSRPCFIMYDHVSKLISVRDIQQCQSGTSTPSSAISDVYIYYNTSENKVYLYMNNAWVARAVALPLCVVNMQTATPYITSINQVFNGFGYIGSTVFALPGVKGLIPNGRNADGSLKNEESTTTSVSIRTSTNWNALVWTGGRKIYVSNSRKYNEQENYIYESNGSKVLQLNIGYAVADSTGRITSFTPKTAFHAVDWNDRETVVGWDKPDYTAGVSMTTPYTALKSGFIIGIHNLSDNGVRSLTINGNVIYNNSSGGKYLGGQSAGFEYAVAKGDVISWTNFNAMTFYPSKGVN